MPDDLPKLTTKQRRFIDLYLGECRFNASRAALEAGYAVRQSAGDLLSNPVVRARIDAELAATSMTSAEVLHELTDVARRPLESFVEVREYGQDVSARMDASAKMKALELLGKAHQMFTDKQQIDLDGGVRLEIVGMADEDLP